MMKRWPNLPTGSCSTATESSDCCSTESPNIAGTNSDMMFVKKKDIETDTCGNGMVETGNRAG